MNNLLLKQTPNQIMDDIKKNDKDLFLQMMNFTPRDVIDYIEFLRKESMQSNISPIRKNINNLNIESLFEMMDLRITLNKAALNMDTSADILYANGLDDQQGKLNFPELKDNVIKADFTKNAKIPARKEVKSFESHGYTRKSILNTPEELPKDVITLISKIGEGKLSQEDLKNSIDRIAVILINQKKDEDALNLLIDLSEAHNLATKEETEKRFMFEILPFAKGVKIDDPKNKKLEKVTLKLWIDYLNDLVELMKTKSSTVKEIVQDSRELAKIYGKDAPFHISFKSQTILNKFGMEIVNENEVINEIAKELKVNSSDLVFDCVNETDCKEVIKLGRVPYNTNIIEDSKSSTVKEIPVIKPQKQEIPKIELREETFTPEPMILNDFKKKVISILNDTTLKNKIQTGYKYFNEGIKLVTDFKDKDNPSSIKIIWEGIKREIGNIKPITTVESNKTEESTSNKEKNKVVENAHEKAIELQKKEESMSDIEKKIREEIRLIISDKHALNHIAKILKSNKIEIKKANLKLDPKKLYDEISAESPFKSDKEIKEEKETIKPVETNESSKGTITPIKTTEEKKNQTSLNNGGPDVKKDYPNYWELAELCTNLEDFNALLVMILSESENDLVTKSGKTHTKNIVAAALAIQYMPFITETKGWDSSKIIAHWRKIKNDYVKQFENKEIKTLPLSQGAPLSGTTKMDVSTKKEGGTQTSNNKTVVAGFKPEKSGEDQSSASVSNIVTQQVASGMNAGQNNVQNKPAGTITEVISGVSMDVKTNTNLNKLGELNSTSVEKTGQNTEVTKENQTVVKKEDVQNVAKSGELNSVTSTASTEKETLNTDVTDLEQSNSSMGNTEKSVKLGEKSLDPVKTEFVEKQQLKSTNIQDKIGAKPVNQDYKLGESKKDSIPNPGVAVKKENTVGNSTDFTSIKEDLNVSQNIKNDTKEENVNGTNHVVPGNPVLEESAKINGEESNNVETIVKESNTNRIKKLSEKFLSDKSISLTFNEKVKKLVTEYLQHNRKWKKAPEHEVNNFVRSIVESSSLLKDTEDGKTFIETVIADQKKRKELKEAENKKTK